ncbi:MAG: hypothetical protein ACTSPD_16015 [Promethearchaeota archaeon]
MGKRRTLFNWEKEEHGFFQKWLFLPVINITIFFLLFQFSAIKEGSNDSIFVG